MQPFSMYIDGQPVQSGNSFEVINPATGKPFAEVQLGSTAHVEQAVAAAKAAFPAWSKTSDEERKALCHALAAALEANFTEFMELVTKETGKPMGGLNGVGAGLEVGGAMYWAQVTADYQLPVDVVQDDDDMRVEVHRKPLGVVASILPWNWPLMIGIWHVIPALRTGNTIVVKPSPLAPLSMIRFAELAQQILPAGVLNIVTGEGDVGGALTSHPDINKIVFTGSTATGPFLMSTSKRLLRSSLVPVSITTARPVQL
jgi:acyl-CoA reductase-like NAD-dependent aldehyde dehydrogenase